MDNIASSFNLSTKLLIKLEKSYKGGTIEQVLIIYKAKKFVIEIG